ncbi:hypothetical protein DL96DRAFT_1817080 [Flagelloscypha sp. PMI_526]|nr:hypothetical protein DL96DRAFT_1817080 [Flagelloscypha sp. PMI_526]
MALPPADFNFFTTFFKHRPFSDDVDSIGTVNLASLEWLEASASKATSRSPFWDILTLYKIKEQSKLYLSRIQSRLDALRKEKWGDERIAAAKRRLSRSVAASQTLISLPEAPVPLLPAVIVYCIFQFVAKNSVLEAKHLGLLSHGVQKWVDPYIFRHIIPLDNFKYIRLAQLQSPRIVQAKKEYFVAVTLLTTFGLVQLPPLWDTFPALRSISSTVIHSIGLTLEPPTPMLRRLHLTEWNAKSLPLSSQIFNTLTHLSIQPDRDMFHYMAWDFTSLKHLGNLTHLLLHPDSKIPLHPNAIHARYLTRFIQDTLIPSLPLSLRIVIWNAGTVSLDRSLADYVHLFNGSVDSRLVLAFQKGDYSSGTRETTEGARIGSLAYVYPEYPSFESAGLEWLECLWEDVEQFVAKR